MSFRNGVYVFNYHQVSDVFIPEFYSRWTYTDRSFFEKQLFFIRKHFQIISVKEALCRQHSGDIDKPYACITFDDGCSSLKAHVLPVLIRYAIPATFFINTAYLDNDKASWCTVYNYLVHSEYKIHIPLSLLEEVKNLRKTRDRQFYERVRREVESLYEFIPEKDRHFYVTRAFLRSLDENLFHIGLHGHEHQRYSMMSETWREHDLKKNIQELREYSNYVNVFAVPFGRPYDWDRATVKICYEHDLDIVFADGGFNQGGEVGLKRMPADSRSVMRLMLRSFCF